MIMISDILKDPFGLAIQDYISNQHEENIIVHSELCDEDVIPVQYLFRSYDEMPVLEQKALELAKGKILDVGAGAGCHAKYLHEQNRDVFAIEISKRSVEYYQSLHIPSACIDFFDMTKKYDTLLFLMNGIGLGGQLANLEKTLLKCKELMLRGGQILCDSTDIKYMYEDEDGSYWMDLNSNYYGEFKFQTTYKNAVSDWFDWLYVDFETLKKVASSCNMTAELVQQGENHDYLAKIVSND